MIEYQAVEDMVLLKKTGLRIDRGFLIGRMYDEAFDVLSLTYT
jgi:hypothetical protein